MTSGSARAGSQDQGGSPGARGGHAPATFKNERVHLPECRLVTYAELYEQWSNDPDLPPVEPPGDPGWAKQAGVMECHPDCPSLAESVALGKRLAKEHGW